MDRQRFKINPDDPQFKPLLEKKIDFAKAEQADSRGKEYTQERQHSQVKNLENAGAYNSTRTNLVDFTTAQKRIHENDIFTDEPQRRDGITEDGTEGNENLIDYKNGLQFMHEDANKFRQHLKKNFANSKQGWIFYQDLISSILDRQDLAKELLDLGSPSIKQLLDAPQSSYQDWSHYIQSVVADITNPELVDDELLSKITENYLIKLERQRNEMSKEIERIKGSYQEIMLAKIQYGTIPLDKEQLLERLNRVVFVLVDPIEWSVNNYDADSDIDKIRIPAIYDANSLMGEDQDEGLQHSVFHELNHFVSATEYETTNDSTGQPSELHGSRFGLQFNSEDNQRSTGQLRWLNEGVTEILARQLRNKDISSAGQYQKERDVIINELGFDSKIPSSLFYKAYFESRDNKSPNETSAVEELVNALRQNFGDDVLIKLEERFNTK